MAEQLVGMGFGAADAAGALAQCGDDVNAALNLLLGGFKAPAAPPPRTPPPSQGRPPPQANQHQVVAVVPAGHTMEVEVGGQRFQVVVPQGVDAGDAFVFALPGAPAPAPQDALTLGRKSLNAARASAHQFATTGQGDQAAVIAQYEAALERLLPLLRVAPDDEGLRAEVTSALDAMETLKATPAGAPVPLTPNIRGGAATPEEGQSGQPRASGRGGFRFNSPRLRRPSLEAQVDPEAATAPPAHLPAPAPPQDEWRLVFRQTVPCFKKQQEWAWVNPTDNKDQNFSILKQLGALNSGDLVIRQSDGSLIEGDEKGQKRPFKFKVQWPGNEKQASQFLHPMIWQQDTNPMAQGGGKVEGYQGIEVPYTSNSWHGLAAGGSPALLNGSKDHRWFYAIGASSNWSGGFPGPDGPKGEQVVELYLSVPGKKALPLTRLLQFDAPAVLRELVQVQAKVAFRGQMYQGVVQGNTSLAEVRAALQTLANASEGIGGGSGSGSGDGGGGMEGDGNPRWVSPEEAAAIQNQPTPPAGRGGGGGGGGGGGRDRHGRRAPSPPSQEANADGRIIGAAGGYVGSGANSGAAGGERVPSHPTRKPQQAVGPAQKPVKEQVPAPQQADGARDPSRQALNAVAGARVNPDSQNRRYPLRYKMDEYESGVYIDEGRTEVDIVRSDRKVPPKEEGNAVMFEVASVFAKLHNVGIVGGERVKEMDHYVASVETPVVRITGPPGTPGTGALPNRTGGGGRPGENVSDITVLVAKMAAESAAPFSARSPAGKKYELCVQDEYKPKPPAKHLAEFITSHAGILHDLLVTILSEILQLPKKHKMKLVYMTTIRADTAIAGKGNDNILYFNVMAFQQAGVCESAAPDKKLTQDAQPRCVAPEQYYRVLRYWTQRAAIAAELPPPTGLYDSGIWERFHRHFDAAVRGGVAQAVPDDD